MKIAKITSLLCSILIIHLLIYVAPAIGQEGTPELSDEDCLTCHSDSELTTEENGRTRSLFVDEGKLKKSVHADNGCVSCHSDIAEIPHAEQLQKVDCSTCHDDAAESFADSSHGKALKAGAAFAPDCSTCHTKHEILPKSEIQSRTHLLNQIELCSSCHLNSEFRQRHPQESPSDLAQYKESVHGLGILKSGLRVSASCVSCHTPHNVRDKNDPKSSVYWKNIPSLCGDCHEGILDDFAKSAHGKIWAQNLPQGPSCITCHTPHAIRDTMSAAFQLHSADTCSQCHETQAPSYQDTFHGKALALGFADSANCADCHTAHLNLPSTNPESSVHSSNLQQTCGQCHTNVTAAFVSFDPHADPHDKEDNPALFYVYNVMVFLLASVFAFFGIHTIFWLQRAIVGYKRGEFAEEKARENGPWVVRFKLSVRIVHLLIMLSFLGLAFTGLPIRYFYAPGVKTLVSLLGGLETFRFFHRLCAIVTFGYAAYHLYTIVNNVLFKRKIGILSGPSSMVPRLKDFKDLSGMFRWFTYLGPRPKFDRWTYWEKFDYFAVFWGIPVIGLSGLMLWFPTLFTKFLPGWVLNIAQVIHSEEALLAVGFIFIFHFFHTHLRPEAFPMDLVIFTGKMPLARLQHERPEEYQRLRASGKLDSALTDPPTQEVRTGAYVIGSFGLTIGLLLAALIVYSFLAY